MREFSDTTAFKCDFNSYIYLVISFTQKHIILVTKQLLSTYYVIEFLVFHKRCDW